MADEQLQPTTSADAPADDTSDVAAAVVTDGAYALTPDFWDIDAAWEAYDELDRAVDYASLKIEGVLVLKKGGDGTVEVQKPTDHSVLGLSGAPWGAWCSACCSRRRSSAAPRCSAPPARASGCLQKRHHRKELAEELTDAIDAGHSGLVLLVSDPAAVELQKALAKADHIVQKAVDKAAAEEIKAEAEAAQATADRLGRTPGEQATARRSSARELEFGTGGRGRDHRGTYARTDRAVTTLG